MASVSILSSLFKLVGGVGREDGAVGRGSTCTTAAAASPSSTGTGRAACSLVCATHLVFISHPEPAYWRGPTGGVSWWAAVDGILARSAGSDLN